VVNLKLEWYSEIKQVLREKGLTEFENQFIQKDKNNQVSDIVKKLLQ